MTELGKLLGAQKIGAATVTDKGLANQIIINAGGNTYGNDQ